MKPHGFTYLTLKSACWFGCPLNRQLAFTECIRKFWKHENRLKNCVVVTFFGQVVSARAKAWALLMTVRQLIATLQANAGDLPNTQAHHQTSVCCAIFQPNESSLRYGRLLRG